MKNRKYSKEAIRCCVDMLSTDLFQGRLYSPFIETVVEFKTEVDFLLGLDQLLDDIGKPQPYAILRTVNANSIQERRYNGHPKQWRTVEDVQSHYGKQSTCDIIVETRRHVEWQGYVLQLSPQAILKFQSSEQCVEIIKRF